MPSKHGKWAPLLGDDLARRVVAVAGTDPGVYCREAVAKAVERDEAARARLAAGNPTQAKCSHPEKDRRYGRCGACGVRGLPEVAKAAKA